MTERLRKIDLLVDIPGPKCLEDELMLVEKTFLAKQFPMVLLKIQEGSLWQNN